MIDVDRLVALVRDDRELEARLGSLNARVRIGPADDAFDVTIELGHVTRVDREARDIDDDLDLVIAAPDQFWRDALVPTPSYAAGSLTAGGAELRGDVARIVAPYYAAWERLLVLLRVAVCGPAATHPPPPDRRDTDDAVGRYAYVGNGEHEARVYYEAAGDGPVPLLLHATAGADSRQWRHVLVYPELRRRFHMVAYDLPAHGRSLPPLGERWWETAYRPHARSSWVGPSGWSSGSVSTVRCSWVARSAASSPSTWPRTTPSTSERSSRSTAGRDRRPACRRSTTHRSGIRRSHPSRTRARARHHLATRA